MSHAIPCARHPARALAVWSGRAVLAVGLVGGGGTQIAAASPGSLQVELASELEWTALNPARGDASPQAATVWGDRTASGPSGFLVRFADGFSSPPHVHNVSYRAVVLEGEVHNDDPGAEPMWMVPGSFWTQPLSESHITSSRGSSVAYVEIDDGPYLVHPADQARVVAEKPVNIDAANLVWTRSAVDGAWMAALWGDPEAAKGGAMLRLQAGAIATVQGPTAPLRAVVIGGTPVFHAPDGESQAAEPGSISTSTSVTLECEPEDPAGACLLYLRTEGGLVLATAHSQTP